MENKFINGDCMHPEYGLPSYPDNFFDLAVVDPPYGIGASKMTMGSGKHNFKKNKTWDNEIPTENYWSELFRVSKNQIVWGGNYFSKYLPPSPHWLVWDKRNPNLSFAEGELAWVYKGKNLRIFQHYSAMVEAGGKVHPTQKPVQLYQWILYNYATEGNLILDTHVGSASSLIACESMGFNYVGFELDADYYEAAKKRLRTVQARLF